MSFAAAVSPGSAENHQAVGKGRHAPASRHVSRSNWSDRGVDGDLDGDSDGDLEELLVPKY
jgi:hypothetical protein